MHPPSLVGNVSLNVRPRGPPKQPRQFKEGDWECPEATCGNINFSKRTKCNRCGIARPKPQVEQYANTNHFGGPPGLFKQGDWPCPHCGNVNWARRDKCNICNANKPTLKTEPRTGRGGGHFDLQDPADRNEHYSDNEEFDEFGRKKKRKGRTQTSDQRFDHGHSNNNSNKRHTSDHRRGRSRDNRDRDSKIRGSLRNRSRSTSYSSSSSNVPYERSRSNLSTSSYSSSCASRVNHDNRGDAYGERNAVKRSE